MSRNKGRVGGPQNKNVDGPFESAPQDGLSSFSFVVPTDFVELPSQGRFYPEGHPLHGQNTIEIRQMTAKEEDMLTSRTLLKKGVALDRVLQNVIVNKGLDANNILVGDRNALIVAMRVAGYGNLYETRVACPSCAKSSDYSFNLSDVGIYDGQEHSELDIADNQNGTFEVQLPVTNVRVTFKLLTGHDENRMLNASNNDKKRKLEERNVTRQLENIIVAVEGNGSNEVLKYLVDNIPSRDSRHLRAAYKAVAPNIDLTQNFKCSECDFSQDMEVPLTADFFWPDR